MSKNMNDWDLFSQMLNEIKKEHNLSDSKEDREKASEIFAKKYFTDDDQDAYHSIKSISKQLNPMDKDKKVQTPLLMSKGYIETTSKITSDLFTSGGSTAIPIERASSI